MMIDRCVRILFCLVSLCRPVVAVAIEDDPVGSSLEQIITRTDDYLENSRYYTRLKNERIDSVRNLLDNSISEEKTRRLIDLGRQYRRCNVDSAAKFFSMAMDHASADLDSAAYIEAMIELSAVNPLRGIIKESIDMFESVNPHALSAEDRLLYFDRGFDLYLTAAQFWSGEKIGRIYMDKSLAMSDSLVANLDPSIPEHAYYKGWSAMRKGDPANALAEMRSALSRTVFGDELYARIAASLADYYTDRNVDPDKAMFYLALSAMSDVAAGTKEMNSLRRLGLELYGRGDIDRAYHYLTVALDNSIESGSKIRTIAEINTLPVVTKAYRDKDNIRIKWLFILVIVLFVTTLALAGIIWRALQSKRKISRYRLRLADKNLHKDEYIKQILAICSSYVERIEELNRLIIRKVKAGQSQDLYRMAENGEVVREQSEKFLSSFDNAFLSIYPEFIDELNQLLRPDARFQIPADNRLTPELRIAAFMRLGVDDGTKIARLSGLSLNTVYTYRNKLRNRAVDRDNFESAIKNIDDLS